jgi:HlyD family secretion protein
MTIAAPDDHGGLPLPVVERRDPTGVPAATRSRPRRAIVAAGGAALLAALFAALFASLFVAGLPTVLRDAAPAQPLPVAPAFRPSVIGLGRLLPAGEVVMVAVPFGAGDARVAVLHVGEGDRVVAGAPIATLDNAASLAAAVDTAAATVAAREATLVQVRQSVAASREETLAALARAEATLRNAERGFDRTEALRSRDIAADATLDQRRAARDEARRETDRLRAMLSRWAASDPDDQADVRVAARNLDAARADLARTVVDLEKAQIRAPHDGTVLTVHAHPGERPGAQGLLSFGDVDRMTAEVEIHESVIGRVAVGDRAEVTAGALPRPLAGTVGRIGMEVVRQALVDPSPAANTDARVVKVTIALDPADAAAARRFTNLQVRVRIAVRGG